MTNQLISISIKKQKLYCFEDDECLHSYSVSTARNGIGEIKGSECTPRGWHRIYSCIGENAHINSVFVGRKWTGEIYNENLAADYPTRDWILTRLLQLDGLEVGRNKGGDVDSLSRYIYIHGVPDDVSLDKPESHGCIRMSNIDIIAFANWVRINSLVCIE